MQRAEEYEQPDSDAIDAVESEGASENTEIQFRVLPGSSKNQKDRTSKNLSCDKEVRKMRDHLTNKQTQ